MKNDYDSWFDAFKPEFNVVISGTTQYKFFVRSHKRVLSSPTLKAFMEMANIHEDKDLKIFNDAYVRMMQLGGFVEWFKNPLRKVSRASEFGASLIFAMSESDMLIRARELYLAEMQEDWSGSPIKNGLSSTTVVHPTTHSSSDEDLARENSACQLTACGVTCKLSKLSCTCR